MKVRLLRGEEAERAAELDKACEGAAHWSVDDYRRLAGALPDEPRFCLLAEDDAGEPAGLLVASVADGEAELLNLAVAAGKRRRGMATALLGEALRRLAAGGAATVWLEVRESNRPALAFYRRHGFQLRDRRRDYYPAPPPAACRQDAGATGAPREDALVLARAVREPGGSL